VASTLSSLIVQPASVKGGTNSFATVTLSAPAPTGGALVMLRCGKPTLATIQSSVRIPAGAISAKVPIKTQPVKTSTIMIISASYGNTLRIVNLTLTP
jgi:hypothetical protein